MFQHSAHAPSPINRCGKMHLIKIHISINNHFDLQCGDISYSMPAATVRFRLITYSLIIIMSYVIDIHVVSVLYN